MQRILAKSETKCIECGKVLTAEEAQKHFHAIQTIVADSAYALILPPGINPGTWQAAASFAESMKELKDSKMPSSKKINFVPFDFSGTMVNQNMSLSVSAYLAIVSDN